MRKGGRDAFYEGPIGKAIADDHAEARRAASPPQDLAAHHSDWVEPLSTTYRGYQVLELPPNTQGIAALEMLNILEGYDLKALGHNTAAYLHLLVEAKRIAFADRDAWIGDPSSTPPRRHRADAVEGVRGGASQGNHRATRRRPNTRALTIDGRIDARTPASTPGRWATRST